MFNIITFGSATSDLFLRLREGSEIAFGKKVLVEDMQITAGGGGTNTACSFASLGLNTAYVGKIGNDKEGDVILNDLKRFGVSKNFIKQDKQRKTAFSCVVSPEKEERVIFVYEGACHFLEIEEIPWKKIKNSQWFYIAPLYKKSTLLLEPILTFARHNGIQVAVNLSLEHLEMGKKNLKNILEKVDVLIMNQEEAKILAGDSSIKDEELIKGLKDLCGGIVVITKGGEGSLVADIKNIYSSGIIKVMEIEKTGAGDAYGSGFVAGLILKNDIEYAIRLAIANSASCIKQVGAKNGLLSRDDLLNLPQVEIIKKHFYV